MAKLIKCKSCSATVSKDAAACPQCGAPVKRKPIGCGGAIVLIVVVLVAVVAIQDRNGSSHSAKPTRTSPKAIPMTKIPGSQWSYIQSDDSMADGNISQAYVSSSNTVSFDFPYSGEQRATLTLRTHPRYGKDLIFQIQEGQILCNSYDGCSVLARFDDGKSVRFKATEPADNSTELIFIQDYHGFVGKMLKAKRVRLSVPIYQEGNPVFDFDVSDFSQSKYLPSG